MRARHPLVQNGLFSPKDNFFRKLISKPSRVHSCLCTCKKSESDVIPLTLNVPCIFESGIEIKIKWNYFPSSLWYLKGLMQVFKTFRGTTKKCENKNFA